MPLTKHTALTCALAAVHVLHERATRAQCTPDVSHALCVQSFSHPPSNNVKSGMCLRFTRYWGN